MLTSALRDECSELPALAGGRFSRHRDFRWLKCTEVLLHSDLFCVTEVSGVSDVKLFLYHFWIVGAKLPPSTFFQANNVQLPYFKLKKKKSEPGL